MQLKKSNRLIRWAYSLSNYGPPYHTTLCALFWRAFVFVPLIWIVFCGAILLVLVGLGMLLWENPIPALTTIGVVILVAFFTVKSIIIKDFYEDVADGLTETEIWQFLKGKLCPIIHLMDDDEVKVIAQDMGHED